ncbi:MAG TPA: hypothetical protein VER96_23100 [Polyangiaceae bacterium]|nr:hypothetical protein [Polyangiaceae bacterium]
MNITTLRALAVIALPALAFIRCGGEQKVAEAPSSMPSAEPPTDQTHDLDASTAQTPQGIDVATPKEAETKPPSKSSSTPATNKHPG